MDHVVVAPELLLLEEVLHLMVVREYRANQVDVGGLDWHHEEVVSISLALCNQDIGNW